MEQRCPREMNPHLPVTALLREMQVGGASEFLVGGEIMGSAL